MNNLPKSKVCPKCGSSNWNIVGRELNPNFLGCRDCGFVGSFMENEKNGIEISKDKIKEGKNK